jgi:hypothetical protein
MIVSVFVKLKHVFRKQRKYPWPKPKLCPRCLMSHLWGHGFVLNYFDGFTHGIYLRRYQCPGCGCVVKLRPAGYFPRFQASIQTIFRSVSRRLNGGKYLPRLSRSRQWYWLYGLNRSTAAYLGDEWSDRLLDAFGCLSRMGHTPVCRSI